MSMKIEIESVRAQVVKIQLSGRLDSETTPQLDDLLIGILAGDTSTVVYDLEHLEYISSAGLRAIFFTAKELEKMAGEMVVINPQPQVQMVFDVVKALPIESIFKSWEEVDEYLDRIQQQAAVE